MPEKGTLLPLPLIHNNAKLDSFTIKFTFNHNLCRYNIEEVLPLAEYQQLHLALVKSLGTTPYSASLISIMQHLTVILTNCYDLIQGRSQKNFSAIGG